MNYNERSHERLGTNTDHSVEHNVCFRIIGGRALDEAGQTNHSRLRQRNQLRKPDSIFIHILCIQRDLGVF